MEQEFTEFGESEITELSRQGSHQSGNSGEILKTFQSGKNTGFSAKIGEKNFKSGNFFSKPFLNL